MRKQKRRFVAKYNLDPETQRRNQNKYHTADDEYEVIAREAYPRTLQILFEERMIGPNVTKRLTALRKRQRAAGIPDDLFYSPMQRKERGLPSLRGRYVRRTKLAS